MTLEEALKNKPNRNENNNKVRFKINNNNKKLNSIKNLKNIPK